MVAVLRRLPDVPVIVMVEPPAAADLVPLNVSVLVPLAPTPPKDAVTPEGSPDAARATVPLKPFCGVIVIVLVPEPPCDKLTLAGAAESVKFEEPVIVSVSRAVLVRPPEVPVIVSVAVVAGAELLAVSVRVLEVVALAGLNDAVTPAGNPDTLRFTALLKPCCGPMVMTLMPLDPAGMETVPEEDRLNDGVLVAPLKRFIKG
jgi:hypothetical protein